MGVVQTNGNAKSTVSTLDTNSTASRSMYLFIVSCTEGSPGRVRQIQLLKVIQLPTVSFVEVPRQKADYSPGNPIGLGDKQYLSQDMRPYLCCLVNAAAVVLIVVV